MDWFHEFQLGRTSVIDRRFKVRGIAEKRDILKNLAAYTLHDILGMRKLSEQWVPYLATSNNQRNCESTSQQS